MPDRISLRDVAAAAACSLGAVSMALAGDRRIAPATRSRICAIAAELGYVRKPLLAGLAARHFRHAAAPIRIAARMAAATAEHLARIAAPLGMEVAHLNAPFAGIQAEAARRGFAGLVVHRRGIRASALSDAAVPTVLWVDEGPDDPPVDVVEDCHWWGATAGAVQRVRAAGYRRPAAVLAPARPRHWHDDVRQACLRHCGVPAHEWRDADAAAAFLRDARADAVIVGTVRQYFELRSADCRLPLACLITYTDSWHGRIAGWVPDFDQRARISLDLIERRLHGIPRAPCRTILSPRWQTGDTLPQRR